MDDLAPAQALLYNDKSVLENHHSRVAFQILEDSALVSRLPAADKRARAGPQTLTQTRICAAG